MRVSDRHDHHPGLHPIAGTEFDNGWASGPRTGTSTAAARPAASGHGPDRADAKYSMVFDPEVRGWTCFV